MVQTQPAMEPLKLIALDKDDMAVISAHLQDAVLKVSDILWRPAEHRLVVGMNRFSKIVSVIREVPLAHDISAIS